ncbi:MAG: hypothetical protein NVS1B4_17720 [Gemmatimonadaceae bacterium]
MRPVRVAVARLTHGHVARIWARAHPEIEIVGIYEPDSDVVDRQATRFKFDRRLVYADLAAMLDATRPEAVVAFGSIHEHLGVVEAAAPRRVHVMVEKPLAVSVDHATKIRDLAQRFGIHVLTNYETTWYPSMVAARRLVEGDSVLGPVRKIVVHDGHQGPREIGVGPEFFEWLTDPVQNGAGALFDFGCYGANLTTWLMNGEAPTTVTAVTQQIKPAIYPKVDDEATIVLTYPRAQAILQASWNWPVSRKDIEIYGTHGYLLAPNGTAVKLRRGPDAGEEAFTPPPRAAPLQDEWQFLAAVVRGSIALSATDLSSLSNNFTVVRILDAARQSARTGRTVTLSP